MQSIPNQMAVKLRKEFDLTEDQKEVIEWIVRGMLESNYHPAFVEGSLRIILTHTRTDGRV